MRGSSTRGEPVSAAELDSRLARDVERGATGLGPHLHEVLVLAADRDLRTYGSQGEQRLAVLSLLLAEAELLAERGSEVPLLLLDDALSELDGDRRRRLSERLGLTGQTVVTATGAEALPLAPAQLLLVSDGDGAGSLMERLGDEVRGSLRAAGVPDAGLLADVVRVWPGAVGPGIATAAWPSRIGRDETLARQHGVVGVGVRADPSRGRDQGQPGGGSARCDGAATAPLHGRPGARHGRPGRAHRRPRGQPGAGAGRVARRSRDRCRRGGRAVA